MCVPLCMYGFECVCVYMYECVFVCVCLYVCVGGVGVSVWACVYVWV